MKEIPQIIKTKALELGFNSVSFYKQDGEALYFSVSIIDENGVAFPTGLPSYLILRGHDISFMQGFI